MIILISILILILIVFYVKESYFNEWYRVWKNGFDDFPLDQFFKECGDNSVLLREYTLDGQPGLTSSNHISIKLKDWLENNEIFTGNKQTKITFFNNSKHPIAKFIINWAETNKHLFPKMLINNNNNTYSFSLRISRNKWTYPSHFDPVEIFTFIVAGNRNVKLNKTIDSKPITLKLNKNDILFFKIGVYHEFWCEEDNELNISLNMAFCPKDTTFLNKFNETYAQTIKKMNGALDYI
jgi:hypothetical protein